MKKYFIYLLTITHVMFADFTSDLSFQIEHRDTNWVFSPFSISNCLSMVAAGAKGKTASEMYSVLQLPEHFEQSFSYLPHTPLFNTDYELSLAQGIWVKEDFEIIPSYIDLLQNTYHSIIQRVPFVNSTVSEINSWIAKKTHQKIQDLLAYSQLTTATRMVLVNALYFSGHWVHPFHSAHTHPNHFHISPDMEPITASFMEQTNTFPYFENEAFQIVGLPCQSAEKSQPLCILVLPKQPEDNSFSPDCLDEFFPLLQKQRVHLSIPAFNIETRMDLKKNLTKLGMVSAFTLSADLSGIGKQQDLYISDVLHKSFFSLTEEGIEAAAATAAVINVTAAAPSVQQQPYHFIANRPFYFLLFYPHTDRNTLLFLGHVQNPCI